MMKKKSIKIIAGVLLLIIGALIVGSRFLKDGDVKNVFDEIYYSGAPKSLNYYLTTRASMMATSCLQRNKESSADFFEGIDEVFKKDCLWSDMIKEINFSYARKPILYFQISFSQIDKESTSVIYFFKYDVEKKVLMIDYRHNYLDGTEIETYETHKLPDSYYEKYNTTREAMIAEADKILYQQLLPLYFDKNKENGNRSRFSMDDLGTYTVNYHF